MTSPIFCDEDDYKGRLVMAFIVVALPLSGWAGMTLGKFFVKLLTGKRHD